MVYDSESTVKGARLYNETQNKIDYTKDDGSFEIEAALGDALIIYSLFHHKISVNVTEALIGDNIVFELKQITTTLAEVDLKKLKTKQFDSTAFQTNLSLPVTTPKIPVLQSGSYARPTVNLISLANAIGKLFTKKKELLPIIKVEDFEKLFETDSFFNSKFLQEDLRVSEADWHLFFEYCASQKLPPALLQNQLLMVEALLECSAGFKNDPSHSIKN